MTNVKHITVEDMVEDLIQEREAFKSGLIERGDLLASANHAGKTFKGLSIMLANAAMRGETPDFAVLGNRSGGGCGKVPGKNKKVANYRMLTVVDGKVEGDGEDAE